MGDRSPAGPAGLARAAMAMVHHAVGDRHCCNRRKRGQAGDHERIGPVDTGRGDRRHDDGRCNRPGAPRPGTIVRPNHGDRGNRPGAPRPGTIVRPNHGDRGNRPGAADGPARSSGRSAPRAAGTNAVTTDSTTTPHEELRDCHGNHSLTPATDPGSRWQGIPLRRPLLCRHFEPYHRPQGRTSGTGLPSGRGFP